MRRLLLIAALAALAGGVSSAAVSPCRATHGMRITLFGGVDDPDVLVWDNRDRLVSFASGSSDTRKFLLPHALLVRPGTVALVQSCVGGAVHSKFRMAPEDAVGVQLVSGKDRGRYGWVSSSDIHGPGIPEPEPQW